ncbi:hypothetical protein YK48G_15090 [Lentilactobacillus fungorum]|uniref:Uncharacterized protein n=1 Tax=Lentilactobacillus fungorum TaxID=2201250 RepID=A0ABQ3W0G7_9LACO|nr:hypothetical protein YK48G_15090 [Lentilactobacillus fungorum]
MHAAFCFAQLSYISERSKAVRDRSVRLLRQKFPGLEFLAEVLTRRSLLCAAVLSVSEARRLESAR